MFNSKVYYFVESSIIANYVLPSIYSLQNLDDYSKVETYKAYSFRVPKTAIKATRLNEKLDGVTFTTDKDINQQGILMFITYDENFKYQNSIQYPLDNGAYTKAQLRKLITDATLSDTGNMYQEDVWFI